MFMPLPIIILCVVLVCILLITSKCKCPTCRVWRVAYVCAFGTLRCEQGHVAHDCTFSALLAISYMYKH